MTIRKLATKLAKLEGKKTQARIGDIRELLSLLSDIVFDERAEEGISASIVAIMANGDKRARKRK